MFSKDGRTGDDQGYAGCQIGRISQTGLRPGTWEFMIRDIYNQNLVYGYCHGTVQAGDNEMVYFNVGGSGCNFGTGTGFPTN